MSRSVHGVGYVSTSQTQLAKLNLQRQYQIGAIAYSINHRVARTLQARQTVHDSHGYIR